MQCKRMLLAIHKGIALQEILRCVVVIIRNKKSLLDETKEASGTTPIPFSLAFSNPAPGNEAMAAVRLDPARLNVDVIAPAFNVVAFCPSVLAAHILIMSFDPNSVAIRSGDLHDFNPGDFRRSDPNVDPDFSFTEGWHRDYGR